jgi:probable HAF family extracellular repeat protein
MEATMKLKVSMCVTAITILAVLALPARSLGQKPNTKLPHYTVIDLGTLGGTYSEVDGISDSGWVLGDASLPGDIYENAFLWRNGVMTNLGTLGGPDSWSGESTNIWGDGVGAAETNTPDPLNENWCGAGDTCLPFLWRNDLQEMIALPLLGGNNGLAWGVNDFRQVVGEAETAATDPTCPSAPQVRPALWHNGQVKALPVFSGDPDGASERINDWGQAVGYSGNCSYSLHAMLWENGKAIYLGSLGGTIRDNATDINNLGQVVGYSGLPGDNTVWHAFLWQKGVMTDLGTLPGDPASWAYGINLEGQIVGWSLDPCRCTTRAFLWQDGVMTDLNTLIPENSPIYLNYAYSINDEGQIVGTGTTSTGETHAFLATPGYGWAESESAPMAASTERPKVNMSENVRKLLRRRARFARSAGGLVTAR